MECGERFAALPYLERKAAKRSPHSIRCRVNSSAIDFKGLLFSQSSHKYDAE
jgi:hypothetical protein